MLAAQCILYTDVLVISEVVNRYVRIDWEMKFRTSYNGQFKNFRCSTDFLPAAKGAADIVRRILGKTNVISDGFEGMQVFDLLRDFESGQYDFNDQVMEKLCAREGLTVLTDDADFAYCSVPVLTANQKLLKS